jgi:hypothetical protein
MKYMMIVKASKQSEAGEMPSRELIEAMGRFNEEMVKAGVMLAGEGLARSAEGVRVRFAGGKVSATDGPFAETKELIAGFWIIQVKSKEEAVQWALRCPPPHGDQESEIELRRIFEVSDFPSDVMTPEEAAREDAMRAEMDRNASSKS